MHTWHGRLVLLGGWINLPLGLRLADYTLRLQITFATVAGVEMCALAFAAYKCATGRPLGSSIKVPFLSKKRVRWANEGQENESPDSGQQYFALTDDNDDDDEDLDDGKPEEGGGKKSGDYRRQTVETCRNESKVNRMGANTQSLDLRRLFANLSDGNVQSSLHSTPLIRLGY